MKMAIEVKALCIAATSSVFAIGIAFCTGIASQNLDAKCEKQASGVRSAAVVDVGAGRSLFLKNCAHCHGDDAHGDEGPDLHALKRSDDFIARRIRNGLKGEMTAFGEKFSEPEIKAITQYLRSLK